MSGVNTKGAVIIGLSMVVCFKNSQFDLGKLCMTKVILIYGFVILLEAFENLPGLSKSSMTNVTFKKINLSTILCISICNRLPQHV